MHALTRKTSRERQASHKQGLGVRKLEFVRRLRPYYDDDDDATVGSTRIFVDVATTAKDGIALLLPHMVLLLLARDPSAELDRPRQSWLPLVLLLLLVTLTTTKSITHQQSFD